MGSNIERLITPVREIASCGSISDSLTVHEKDEAIIPAYVHNELSRNCGQRKSLFEMENYRLAKGRCRVGDPRSCPLRTWCDFLRGKQDASVAQAKEKDRDSEARGLPLIHF